MSQISVVVFNCVMKSDSMKRNGKEMYGVGGTRMF
jgi:hypothetical protein